MSRVLLKRKIPPPSPQLELIKNELTAAIGDASYRGYAVVSIPELAQARVKISQLDAERTALLEKLYFKEAICDALAEQVMVLTRALSDAQNCLAKTKVKGS